MRAWTNSVNWHTKQKNAKWYDDTTEIMKMKINNDCKLCDPLENQKISGDKVCRHHQTSVNSAATAAFLSSPHYFRDFLAFHILKGNYWLLYFGMFCWWSSKTWSIRTISGKSRLKILPLSPLIDAFRIMISIWTRNELREERDHDGYDHWPSPAHLANVNTLVDAGELLRRRTFRSRQKYH